MKSESTLPDGFIRLEKHIAQLGLASRREAKALIESGNIMVNGKIIFETGMGIDPNRDKVELVGILPLKETVLLYKPRGIETSKTNPDNEDIHDIFPELCHLAPVGRLDKDSEGLILLTNDGTITKAITGENSSIEKEYQVTVRESVTDEALQKMAKGIILDEIMTLPAMTKKINNHTFSIILHEGRKHQIRRMADACHLTIEKLERVRIGNLGNDNLRPGTYRNVTDEEVKELKYYDS